MPNVIGTQRSPCGDCRHPYVMHHPRDGCQAVDEYVAGHGNVLEEPCTCKCYVPGKQEGCK